MATEATESGDPAPVKQDGAEEAGGDPTPGTSTDGDTAAAAPDGTSGENTTTEGDADAAAPVKDENGEAATAGGDSGGGDNNATAEEGAATSGDTKGDEAKTDVEDDAPKTFPQVVRTKMAARSASLHKLDDT